jgi:hypothetical protein
MVLYITSITEEIEPTVPLIIWCLIPGICCTVIELCELLAHGLNKET